jgi:hypothetical protein
MASTFERAFWGTGDIASSKVALSQMEMLVNDALKETMLFTEYLQKRILVEQNYASALAALKPFTINDKAPNTSLRHGLTMLNDSTQTTVGAAM